MIGEWVIFYHKIGQKLYKLLMSSTDLSHEMVITLDMAYICAIGLSIDEIKENKSNII